MKERERNTLWWAYDMDSKKAKKRNSASREKHPTTLDCFLSDKLSLLHFRNRYARMSSRPEKERGNCTAAAGGQDGGTERAALRI